MANIRRASNGKAIDLDILKAKNETVIALGNQKVNARGDKLGAGGKIIKTKAEIMNEYYALNTPVASHEMPTPAKQQSAPVQPVVNPISGLDPEDFAEPEIIQSTQVPEPIVTAKLEPDALPVTPPEAVAATSPSNIPVEPANPEIAPEVAPVIRGSLADAIAKNTVVTQTEMLPPSKANGIQRF